MGQKKIILSWAITFLVYGTGIIFKFIKELLIHVF